MIKNKFSSFVIEKSFQIIISIDENYFNKNRNNNFIKKLNNNNFSSSESEGEENEENNINNDIKENKNGSNTSDGVSNNILDYENFILFKNKIFYIFENNASNKEKEKVINLLKQNYTFQNYVNNKNANGYQIHNKNC
jgi:hypothetical protein